MWGCELGLMVSPPFLPCCHPSDCGRLFRARLMLGSVYHLKAARLFSKRSCLFAVDCCFLMDMWLQLQFCWSGSLGQSLC